VDGNNGFSWNITVPKNLGGINTILSDKIIGTSGLASFQYGVGPYSVWAMSLEPGSMGTILWEHDFAGAPTPNATVIMGPVSEEDGVFMMRVKETRQWYGYDLNSGKQIWGPTDSQEQYNMYGMGGNIAYGKLYSTGYAGILYCYNATTGSLLWNSSLNTGGLEGPYPNWPAASTYIADHKVYITTGEHSHTQPLLRGWTIYCFDAETGKGLWNITNLASALSIADGYLVDFDYMDNSIYCFGKGQTATTVMASPDVSTHGDSVLIKGTVTDQSPGAAGTPAIADQYMTEWMEYLYHQRQMPKAAGVEVVLETLDPNGNFYEIGRTTSDASGMYSYPFTPEVPGLYTLIATFEGSGSYFSSVAEIAINVLEAPQATPTPTLPPSNTNTYVIGFGSAALIAIIVVGVILILLRKR
jgi:outer membrane protein assembly factor BamB